MIISHRHRFIFLRTEKTAGSSLSKALRPQLGPGDVVVGRDAAARRLRGLSGTLRRRWGGAFGLHQHASAAQVRRFVGEEVWRSYHKFAVERNPWDRQVSLYFQRVAKRGRLADFDRDMRSPLFRLLHHVRLRNWEVYAIGDRIVADEVIRYEALGTALPALVERLGLAPLTLPRLRSGHREAGRDYREHYTPATRDLVARWHRREIEAFGYVF